MDKELEAIYHDPSLGGEGYLVFTGEGWKVQPRPALSEIERRRALAFLFKAWAQLVPAGVLRKIWNEEAPGIHHHELPSILGEDGFLCMYAAAVGVTVALFRTIHRRVLGEETVALPPLFVGETDEASRFFDVNATPPGVYSKLFSAMRLKKDPQLIAMIQHDLLEVAKMEDFDKRRLLTLAILAHGASYREIDGRVLQLPSLVAPKPGVLVSFYFSQHLLWEGVKTISVYPLEREGEEPGLYLCQGTEIWPSQPAMLGSIFANLGREGAATEPYAHCWRQIHKHLRTLTKVRPPLVAGHSMGGSLATQIALYSHPLIERAYVFNPPAAGKRDYEVYHRLSTQVQHKLQVFASIDDLPFWRMGTALIGNITLFLGEERWRYRPLKRWEFYTFIPGLVKTLINMVNALPAHQRIVPLLRSYIYLKLTQEEIDLENYERIRRFDHLTFFPKLYRPARALLTWVRRFFGWQLQDEYIKSQIEIIELHEADLKETMVMEGSTELLQQLQELERQKQELIERLLKR